MKNTVMSPERAKGIFLPKSPFTPPGLLLLLFMTGGLRPISAKLFLIFITGSPISNIEQGIMNVEG